MRSFFNIILSGVLLAVLMSGCQPSTVLETGVEGVTIPDNLGGDMTLPESSSYVIPDDAETGVNGGPGAMSTTAADYSYYPEDRRQESTETTQTGTMVILYVPHSNGIISSFDFVDTIDADSLIGALINNNALTDDITAESFEISEDGQSATLTVTGARSVYEAATEEQVVTAIANTFIDNFNLHSISVNVTESGNNYENLSFSQEFDAKRQSAGESSEDSTTQKTDQAESEANESSGDTGSTD